MKFCSWQLWRSTKETESYALYAEADTAEIRYPTNVWYPPTHEYQLKLRLHKYLLASQWYPFDKSTEGERPVRKAIVMGAKRVLKQK